MTLANKITISRMLIIPIMIVIISIPALENIVSIEQFNLSLAQFIFAVLFIVAASTDFLDGYFARKRNEITTFGKFLDPIADKMLVVVAFIYLVFKGDCDVWVLSVIILREFMVSGIRLLAVGKSEVIAASIWGKIKTFSSIIVLIFLLFNQFGTNVYFGNEYFNLGRLLTWVVALITLISGIDYFIKSRKIIFESI